MQAPTTMRFGIADPPATGGGRPASGSQVELCDRGDYERADSLSPSQLREALTRLGVSSYRMTVAWRTLQPAGSGPLEPAALRAVRAQLQALREANISCQLALSGVELPVPIEQRGGWYARECARAYADFHARLAAGLGELVEGWIPLWDPFTIAGACADPGDYLQRAHHLNYAHGLAAAAIRREAGGQARVGIGLGVQVIDPADESQHRDVHAADAAASWANKVFLGPLLDSTYPIDVVGSTRKVCHWDFVQPGDLEICRTRLDFMAVDYRGIATVRANEQADPPPPWVGSGQWEFVRADNGAYVRHEPRGIYDLVAALDTAYHGLELHVNMQVRTRETPTQVRREYLRTHLAELAAARADGANVRGFWLWSLTGERSGIGQVKATGVEFDEFGQWYGQQALTHREVAINEAVRTPKRRWLFWRR